MKWQHVLTHAIVAALAAGCGGGAREFSDVAAAPTEATTASPTPPAAPAAASPVPSSLSLSSNVPNVTSDGKSVVTMTATVKDAGNVALQGQAVSFSTNDAGAVIVVKQGATDAGGRATAEITVTDRTNRAIAVRAAAGALTTTTAFDVTGTTLQLNGPRSAQANTPVTFTATVRDAAGVPLPNVAVTATSAKSAPVSLSASVTDAQGQIVVRSVAPVGGDTITVSGAGAQAAAGYAVSASDIVLVTPASNAQVEVDTPVTVLVRYRRAGAPVAGIPLTMTATRGSLASQTAVTDVDGVAAVGLTSKFSGSSLVTATAPDGTVGEGRIEFVSSVAAQVELQPSPSVVNVNLAGTTPQGSTLIAVVRDVTGNPVRGARVDFAAVRDPSSGSISPAFAFTDSAGVATSSFFAGSNATGPGADVTTRPPSPLEFSDILLRATVFGQTLAGQPIVDDASLTAKRRELQVRIGSGNTVLVPPAPDDAVYNDLPYGVVVTDSAGNPARNVTVQASVVGLRYRKGSWLRNSTGATPIWRQQVEAVCSSEDVNRNLRLDTVGTLTGTGEDLNGDGELTPGNVATVYFPGAGNPGIGTTDETGTVSMRVRYPRDRGGWVEVLLRVTAAMTGGTEGATEAAFVLPVRGSDLADANISPPGTPNPYGIGPCP